MKKISILVYRPAASAIMVAQKEPAGNFRHRKKKYSSTYLYGPPILPCHEGYNDNLNSSSAGMHLLLLLYSQGYSVISPSPSKHCALPHRLMMMTLARMYGNTMTVATARETAPIAKASTARTQPGNTSNT